MIIKYQKIIIIALSIFTGLLLSPSSHALSCRQGSSPSSSSPVGKTLDNFSIGYVSFARSDFVAGKVLWRSQNYTSTFTCWDTDNHPQGEDAWIYWDPQGELNKIDPSLSIGVTINGRDYDGVNQKTGLRAVNVGKGTIRYDERGARVAIPQTITFSFSIYIKATGAKPPARYYDIGHARVLQIDGELGLNKTTRDSNYIVNLTNFNNINIVECSPTVDIDPKVVTFGSIARETSAIGKVAKQLPFKVTANVQGGGCKGELLLISFTSNDLSPNDRTLLIPAQNSGVGITLAKQNNPSKLIEFGQGHLFISSPITESSTIIPIDYLASLKWLTNDPAVGTFSTTASVNITFR